MLVVDAVVVTIVVGVVLDVDGVVVNVDILVVIVADVLVVTWVVVVVVLVLRGRRCCRHCGCRGAARQRGCREHRRVWLETLTVIVKVAKLAFWVGNCKCVAIDGCTSGENILYVFAHRGDARMQTRSHTSRRNHYLPTSLIAPAAFTEVGIMAKLADRGRAFEK